MTDGPDPIEQARNELAARVSNATGAAIVRQFAASLVSGMGHEFAYDVAANIVEMLANQSAGANAPPSVVFALRMSRAMLKAAVAEKDGAQNEATGGLIIAAPDTRVNGKRVA